MFHMIQFKQLQQKRLTHSWTVACITWKSHSDSDFFLQLASLLGGKNRSKGRWHADNVGTARRLSFVSNFELTEWLYSSNLSVTPGWNQKTPKGKKQLNLTSGKVVQAVIFQDMHLFKRRNVSWEVCQQEIWFSWGNDIMESEISTNFPRRKERKHSRREFPLKRKSFQFVITFFFSVVANLLQLECSWILPLHLVESLERYIIMWKHERKFSSAKLKLYIYIYLILWKSSLRVVECSYEMWVRRKLI